MSGRRLFILMFGALGLWTFAMGTSKALEGMNALSWPTVQGRIIMSKSDEMRTSKDIRVARLCMRLDYLYMVDGVIYEGHRVSVGWQCFGSESRIKALLKRYRPNTVVTVYYNPEMPQRSLLEPGLDWTVFFLWGVSLTTLSLVWPLLRKERKRA